MTTVVVRWVSADGTAHMADGASAIEPPTDAAWSWIDVDSSDNATLSALGERQRQGHEGHEQRVLNQVLPVILLPEVLQYRH